MLVEAGLTPVKQFKRQPERRAGLGKDKDYGSVEKGKVADLVIVRGDPRRNISDTQNVEMVFIEGRSWTSRIIRTTKPDPDQ
jgi:alpha-D-ribose 1-methylphosphonate 5-triphosphate diphosphatase PhnM